MPRKKLANQEQLLKRNVIIRLPQRQYDKLMQIQMESNCHSIAEVIRKMIDGKKIKCFYRDLSLHAPLEEMAMIRKELRAIGININQITRSFNSEKSSESARAYYVMKVADLYQKVDLKVERLLELIGKLAERWLLKS